MRKDRQKDCTEYIQALTEYWKIKGQEKKIIEGKLEDLKNDGIKF
jgi:hypothetical protein